jgi:hypothetical protein
MADSSLTPQPERRPAYDVNLEEHGIDPLSLAAGAAIYKAVDLAGDYAAGKLAAARRPTNAATPDATPKDSPGSNDGGQG